eukprot:9232339-Pyramimonas_sp.AAC.1
MVAKAGGPKVAVAGAAAPRCSSCAERPRKRPRPGPPARGRSDIQTRWSRQTCSRSAIRVAKAG